MGKYHVMVCGTTPCMLQGAREIYQTLKQHLGVDYGQTTEVGSPDLLSDCCTCFLLIYVDFSVRISKHTVMTNQVCNMYDLIV